MTSWFNRFLKATDSPETAAYKAVRVASKSWFPKVMEHPACKAFDLIKAARKLTLPVEGRTIVFEGEIEQALLMDFYLVDYRPDERSVMECVNFPPGRLTPDEEDFHRAMLASYTSLFEVIAVHDRQPQILLRDLLNSERPQFWLTDEGLSGSIPSLGKILLFTRVVSMASLRMTGGVSFCFDPKHEAAICTGYHRAMWSVPAPRHNQRRTIFFLAQHRRHGIDQIYAAVVPPEPGSS